MNEVKLSSTLLYDKAANEWEEALPLGNGRIGAMVFGGALKERVQLNEDTLWSGFPRDTNNYEALRYLAKAREMLEAGQYAEAEQWIQKNMLSVNCQAYQPFGELWIEILQHEQKANRQQNDVATNYTRSLDLDRAIVSSQFQLGEQTINKQSWISYPHQVLVIQFTTSKNKGLSTHIYFDVPHPAKLVVTKNGMYGVIGNCPTHIADNYAQNHPYAVQYEENAGIKFNGLVQAVSDGHIVSDETGITVKNASVITYYVSLKSSFLGFNLMPHQDEAALISSNEQTIQKAVEAGDIALLQSHINDYQHLYHRVSLTLQNSNHHNYHSHLSTDKRLERYKLGECDVKLEELYFNFGRYLLISSSRAGTQAANLQGIWNHHVQPPWFSSYTTNINLEMNYWPVETLNLSECHEPLFSLIEELSITGARTARVHYNARGWTAHHNVDIWRMSSPTAGHPSWAFWPMASIWLCQHLWERYQFQPDETFLQAKAYPIMRGAALFALDWLVENKFGELITTPSTSPENKFVYGSNQVSSVATGSAMDMTLLRELFEHCLEAITILKLEDSIKHELETAIVKLAKVKISEQGHIQEWDEYMEDYEPGHRHVSHLYGLYPGTTFQKHIDNSYVEAARRSLEHRITHGGGHTGWSCAWLINLYARLKDSKRAYQFIRNLLTRSTYSNLFDAHPPFQIDGNFGGIAGMLEVLIQSHLGEIEFLPALPSEWENGLLEGIAVRGGFTVQMNWKHHKLVEATIVSHYGNPLKLTNGELYKIVEKQTETVYMNCLKANETKVNYHYIVTPV